jgi:VWFA-related protein
VTLEKMLRKVHESEVALFTVGLLNEEERRAARRTRRALTTLAEDSGGAAFFPKDASEVDEIARRIATDIRNQYILSYNPTNESEDGGFRQVKVNLVGTPKSYSVRTRTGYYARGSGSAQVTSVPTTPPPTSLRPK